MMCCVVLQVAAHEAARIAEVGLQRLIAQKRLVLVLDLDHTLLNTGVPAQHMLTCMSIKL
jgi:predicted secreted acid phosphatase